MLDITDLAYTRLRSALFGSPLETTVNAGLDLVRATVGLTVEEIAALTPVPACIDGPSRSPFFALQALLTACYGNGPVAERTVLAAATAELTNLAVIAHDLTGSDDVVDRSLAILIGDTFFAAAAGHAAILGSGSVRMHAAAFAQATLARLGAAGTRLTRPGDAALAAGSARLGGLVAGTPREVTDAVAACSAAFAEPSVKAGNEAAEALDRLPAHPATAVLAVLARGHAGAARGHLV